MTRRRRHTARRHHTAGAALASLLAASLVLAAPADGRAQGRHTLSGGVITNPEGLFLRYDYGEPLGESGWWLGGFANHLVFSNEFGVQLQFQTDPAFFEVHLDLAFEPGVFRKLNATNRQSPDPPDRTAGMRYVARAQSNFNLKLAHVWFYNRLTGLFRYRDFQEQDTFLDFELGRETSIENATALFFRLGGTPPVLTSPNPPGPALWTYVEYTIGGVRGVGDYPNRISTGLFSEHWPAQGVLLNLDLFYSFAEPNDGPGAILLFWFIWS